jgi:hypothetical protein
MVCSLAHAAACPDPAAIEDADSTRKQLAFSIRGQSLSSIAAKSDSSEPEIIATRSPRLPRAARIESQNLQR